MTIEHPCFQTFFFFFIIEGTCFMLTFIETDNVIIRLKKDFHGESTEKESQVKCCINVERCVNIDFQCMLRSNQT